MRYKKSAPNNLLLICQTLIVFSCATLTTHSDYDPAVDFASYETFAWQDEASHAASDHTMGDYVSPLNLQRIEAAIENELLTKGYTRVERSDAADFLVTYTVGHRDRFNVGTYPVTYRSRWVAHWPYYAEEIELHRYSEGMLAVDIFDSASGRPVWHGFATKRITDADRDQVASLVRKTVAAIFSGFPPIPSDLGG